MISNIYTKVYQSYGKKLKINKIIIEDYKHKNGYPVFEQNSFSKASTVIYKNGLDFIRLMKWLAYYDLFLMKITTIMT